MIDSVETDAGDVSPDLKKTRRQKAATTGAARIDRLPPHSIEAEQGVLGCVLLSPGECLGVCIEKFKSIPEFWFSACCARGRGSICGTFATDSSPSGTSPS